MGLLEKAYKYKQQLNEQGKDTIIDKISGPADTDFLPDDLPEEESIDLLNIEENGVTTVSNNASHEIDQSFSFDDLSGEEFFETEIEKQAEINKPTDNIDENISINDLSGDELKELGIGQEEGVSESIVSESIDEKDENISINDLSGDELKELGIGQEEGVSESIVNESIDETDENISINDLSGDELKELGIGEEEGVSESIVNESIDETDENISINDLSGDELKELGIGEEEGVSESIFNEAIDGNENFTIDDFSESELGIKEDSEKNEIGQAGENIDISEEILDEIDELDISNENRDNNLENSLDENFDINTGFIDEQNGVTMDFSDDINNQIQDQDGQRSVPVFKGEQSNSNVNDPVSKNYINKEKEHNDFIVRYEICKEIIKAKSFDELYDVFLFSIMGQIGASSASIIGYPGIEEKKDNTKWILKEARGIKLTNKNISFKAGSKILQELTNNKNIIDIDKYKNDNNCREEYLVFVSIDARLVCPFVVEGEVLGAICLGEKITIGEYSAEEKDFLKSICDIFSIINNKLEKTHLLNIESNRLKQYEKHMEFIEKYEATIKNTENDEEINDFIQQEIRQFQIDSYAIFIKDEISNIYKIMYCEKKDYLGLKLDNFTIKGDKNPFIEKMMNYKSLTIIDIHEKLSYITTIFDEKIIKKTNLLAIYPYFFANVLRGFLIIFRADLDFLNESKKEINVFTKTVFSFLLSKKSIEQYEARFIDNYEIIQKRINNNLINAKNLNIPLIIGMVSIKNYKRLISILGKSEINLFLNDLELNIKNRLSEGDFCYRYDRNKLLLVLPGKNKKFAVPMINSVRNQICKQYNNENIQVLITFLLAQYPEDGKTFDSLLDNID